MAWKVKLTMLLNIDFVVGRKSCLKFLGAANIDHFFYFRVKVFIFVPYFRLHIWNYKMMPQGFLSKLDKSVMILNANRAKTSFVIVWWVFAQFQENNACVPLFISKIFQTCVTAIFKFYVTSVHQTQFLNQTVLSGCSLEFSFYFSSWMLWEMKITIW